MMESPNMPQPKPRPGRGPAIPDLVVADIRERDAAGTKKYGQRLQAHDDRNHLIDAYQEALDLVMYLRQEIAERETCKESLQVQPPAGPSGIATLEADNRRLREDNAELKKDCDHWANQLSERDRANDEALDVLRRLKQVRVAGYPAPVIVLCGVVPLEEEWADIQGIIERDGTPQPAAPQLSGEAEEKE